MKISAVIVNWNTRDMLLECLASLDRQEGVFDKEVIVVDNGSTDGSSKAVRSAFPDTILIENSVNTGFACANNLGINKSTGDYVCLINSDVELLDGCLFKMMVYMESDLRIGVAGPKILNPDRTLQNSCRKFPSLWNNLCLALGLDKVFKHIPVFSGEHMRYFPHDIQMNVDYLAGCFLMVRRGALTEVGLLDERYFIYQEEVDWCKQFHKMGWKVSFYPGAAVVHHHAASSSKDPVRFTVARQKALVQYWQKHHSAMSGWALRSILITNRVLRIVGRSILLLAQMSRRARLRNKLKEDIACLGALLRRAV